jgi:hypothetical protein
VSEAASQKENSEALRRRRNSQEAVIRKIVELLDEYPELRVMQLIGNATPTDEAKRRNNDLYYVEDELLLEWLETLEIRLKTVEQAFRRDLQRRPPNAG